MIGDDEFEHRSSCIDHADIMGVDHHSFLYFSNTRWSQIATSFDLDNTNTASTRLIFYAHVSEFEVAQCGNIDSKLTCRFQNGCPFFDFNFFIVDGKFYHFHKIAFFERLEKNDLQFFSIQMPG
ncbi:MAG: hypothetical protein BWZ06_01900 [Bacteroidetes bacterium ADurb.BinA261]|nr:MAG: hypothetical protein BWZ06_01900 [Bacteroidetes bacterium ADurb.BinA261]